MLALFTVAIFTALQPNLGSQTALRHAGRRHYLLAGAANMAGGYLGSRIAVRQGNGFIRLVLLLVVTILMLKLVWDVWQENFTRSAAV